MTPENVYESPQGKRECRTCTRARRKLRHRTDNTDKKVLCPVCGRERRPARVRDESLATGICTTCVRETFLEGEAVVEPTDELRQWWRDRFTDAELLVLAQGLIPTAPEHRLDLRLAPIRGGHDVPDTMEEEVAA